MFLWQPFCVYQLIAGYSRIALIACSNMWEYVWIVNDFAPSIKLFILFYLQKNWNLIQLNWWLVSSLKNLVLFRLPLFIPVYLLVWRNNRGLIREQYGTFFGHIKKLYLRDKIHRWSEHSVAVGELESYAYFSFMALQPTKGSNLLQSLYWWFMPLLVHHCKTALTEWINCEEALLLLSELEYLKQGHTRAKL